MTDVHGHGPLVEFGTGFQLTRILELPHGRIQWQRAPGRHYPGEYPEVDRRFVRLAETVSDRWTRFTVPSGTSGRARIWEVNGRHSLAELILTGDDPTGRLHQTVERLGSRVRALHDASRTEACGYPQPPGPARLMAWIEGGRGPLASSAWRHRLRSQLGSQRWGKLHDVARDVSRPRPTERTVVLHGWFSLGSVVVADEPGAEPAAAVLSGLEVARGRPEVDVACLLGELVEFSAVAAREGRTRPVLATLRDSFLAGYGPGWDRDLVAAGAIARVATHSHDFAAYLGWHEDLHAYAPMLADLIDSDGAAALPSK